MTDKSKPRLEVPDEEVVEYLRKHGASRSADIAKDLHADPWGVAAALGRLSFRNRRARWTMVGGKMLFELSQAEKAGP